MKYILLDTCCFIDALKGDNSKFDYEAIKEYARNNNSFIIISPYTFYEVIKAVNTVDEVKNLRNELINFGDFWIQNLNRIFGDVNIEYGLDFIFIMKMHSDEKLIEFAEEKRKLRKRVYDSLFNNMLFYLIVVAIIYVYLTECDENGDLDKDASYKIDYINRYFLKVHESRYKTILTEVYKHAGLCCYDPFKKTFFRDWNSEDILKEQMLEIIMEILAISDVVLTIAKDGKPVDNSTFNSMIINKCRLLVNDINANSFKTAYKAYCRKTNNKNTIPQFYDMMTSDFDDNLSKECYKHMIIKLFQIGGFGKAFNNDFIDMVNIRVFEHYKKGEAVYLTGDRDWQNLIMNSKNEVTKESKEFYRKYRKIGTGNT